MRTSNRVEFPFATVCLRATAAKCFKKIEHSTALIWKLWQVAESTFRRRKGAEFLPAVSAGLQGIEGGQQTKNSHQKVAA